TYTENVVTNKPDETDWYRIGVPIETRTYEITGILSQEDVLYKLDAVQDAFQNAAEIQYEMQPATGVSQKRLIEHIRSLYHKNDLSVPLTLEEVDSLALPYESYKLAFTTGLLTEVYGSRVSNTLLQDEGKYLLWDGAWWIPSGRSFHSPDPANPEPLFAHDHFYLPQGFQDPFGNIYKTTYDNYDLMVTQTEDPLGNVAKAQNNYRTMLPWHITDPND
ncbi:MAG: SpvB/TcaC N-terminal domain-containing protein, partial [Nitrososphaera sp.]